MASAALRSAGRALRRSVPQGPSLRSPVSGFAGRPSLSKYSTSSSGLQVNGVRYQALDAKLDELTRVEDGLKNVFKELELVLEKKDTTARRYARQRPFKMLAGAMVGFGLGFYTNQYVSA